MWPWCTRLYIYESIGNKNKGFFSRLFGIEKKKEREVDHIYYCRLKTKDGSVVHTGDNITGECGGDDEQIIVNLDLLGENISRICFSVHIFSGASSFSSIQGAFIRIVDKRTNEVICKYNLTTSKIADDEYTFGNLVKQEGEWYFQADE